MSNADNDIDIDIEKKINWKYEIGEIISLINPDGNFKYNFTITNREIRIRKIKDSTCKDGFSNCTERFYEYTCNICGAKGLWKIEHNIHRTGCHCCSGKIRLKGVNTIGDIYPDFIEYFKGIDVYNPDLSPKDIVILTCPICNHTKKVKIEQLKYGFYCNYCNSIGNKFPHLIKYFHNKEDAFKYSYGSGKKVILQCPDCKHKQTTYISVLVNNGFHCEHCGDKISFPEKFIIELLSQLNVDFTTQLSAKALKWSNKNYKYDFYIPKINCIIEVHGEQHYQNGFESYGGKSIKEEQENDIIKEQLARKNKITNYIVLDCQKSTMEWIKNSVINSEINKIYDLSIIDWNKCAEFATKNIVKQVCDYWNKHHYLTTNDLALIFHISGQTIRKYLVKGTKLNWCTYDVNQEIKKRKIKAIEKTKKQVAVFKENKCIGIFDSVAELSRKSTELFGKKLNVSCIYKVCNNDRPNNKNWKHYKGFVFKYT